MRPCGGDQIWPELVVGKSKPDEFNHPLSARMSRFGLLQCVKSLSERIDTFENLAYPAFGDV